MGYYHGQLRADTLWLEIWVELWIGILGIWILCAKISALFVENGGPNICWRLNLISTSIQVQHKSEDHRSRYARKNYLDLCNIMNWESLCTCLLTVTSSLLMTATNVLRLADRGHWTWRKERLYWKYLSSHQWWNYHFRYGAYIVSCNICALTQGHSPVPREYFSSPNVSSHTRNIIHLV